MLIHNLIIIPFKNRFITLATPDFFKILKDCLRIVMKIMNHHVATVTKCLKIFRRMIIVTIMVLNDTLFLLASVAPKLFGLWNETRCNSQLGLF